MIPLYAIMLGLSLSAAGAATPEEQPAFRHLRALWDTTGPALPALAKDATAWRLVEVTPAADSGQAAGFYIDGTTGKLVQQPGVAQGTTVKGTVRTVLRFDGGAVTSEPVAYSWTLPLNQRGREAEQTVYSPFESGGLVLSQFAGAAGKEADFGTCALIPGDWKQALAEFIKARADAGAKWMAAKTPADQAGLVRQVAVPNPFVAMTALRTLREAAAAGASLPGGADSQALILRAVPGVQPLLWTDHLRAVSGSPQKLALISTFVAGETKCARLVPLATAARSVFECAPVKDQALRQTARILLQQCRTALERQPEGTDSEQAELDRITKL